MSDGNDALGHPNFVSDEFTRDFSTPTKTLWRIASCELSNDCFEECNPGAQLNRIVIGAITHVGMDNMDHSIYASEVIIEIHARCSGPKKRLFREKLCAIVGERTIINLPAEPNTPQ